MLRVSKGIKSGGGCLRRESHFQRRKPTNIVAVPHGRKLLDKVEQTRYVLAAHPRRLSRERINRPFPRNLHSFCSLDG